MMSMKTKRGTRILSQRAWVDGIIGIAVDGIIGTAVVGIIIIITGTGVDGIIIIIMTGAGVGIITIIIMTGAGVGAGVGNGSCCAEQNKVA